MKKPPGHPTVFPHPMVADAAGLVRFLRDGLGAVEDGRTVAADGRLAHRPVDRSAPRRRPL